MRGVALLVLVLVLAGCAGAAGPGVPADAARLPPGAFGTGDDAPAAVAEYAFGDAGRTYGRPDAGARAAAAVEYMAGAAQVEPVWADVSAASKAELLDARAELRGVLHVRPGAGSQAVLDGLLAAAGRLAANDEAGAGAALDRSGAFAVPGTEVVAVLSNLPYLRDVNLATQHAADELAHNDTEFRRF